MFGLESPFFPFLVVLASTCINCKYRINNKLSHEVLNCGPFRFRRRISNDPVFTRVNFLKFTLLCSWTLFMDNRHWIHLFSIDGLVLTHFLETQHTVVHCLDRWSISTKIDVIGNEGIMLPQKAVTPSSSKSCWDFKLNEDFLIVNCGRGELSP